MKKWYEKLFTNYAKTYDTESFTKGTLQEVDFIEKEIKHNKNIKILDVGCGTGRHSIELAKRGYDVSGIDLSKNQLAHARRKANDACVQVSFFQKDARKFVMPQKYDLVIMLCEGGFSLMETDENNFSILKRCSMTLKEKGKFIFSCLNALFPLNNSVKDFLNADSAVGPTTKLTFDWMTLRERSLLKAKDDSGKTQILKCNERYYMPSEITWYLKSLKFKKVNIYGCDVGRFSKKTKLTSKNFEMLVIADK
ncbi:MAG: class I SAM-dependent methyltransferase [Endomicrobiales bacterium]|nr:class I SAM-dependent methyltransferase [Endomicrobiales bacterium]